MSTADAPIRWWLFRQLPRVQKAFNDVDNCPCGTEGSCERCLPAVDYLKQLWEAWIHHPIRFLLGSYGDSTYQHGYPLELLSRLNHRLFGFRRGCSCTTCFARRREAA